MAWHPSGVGGVRVVPDLGRLADLVRIQGLGIRVLVEREDPSLLRLVHALNLAQGLQQPPKLRRSVPWDREQARRPPQNRLEAGLQAWM